MICHLENIDLFIRETPPSRAVFALGKQDDTVQPPQPVPSPLGHVRLRLRDERGRTAWGCAGDRLSVRWLDKRPGRAEGLKLRELVSLIQFAREEYLREPAFESPFAQWLKCHKPIMQTGAERGAEALTASFASALMERALLDAFCRLHGEPIFKMIREDRIGFRPGAVHREAEGHRLVDSLPAKPVTRFHIRHTVGWLDPLTAADISPANRINDGEPETLEEYVQRHGLRYFKVKISGDPDRDLERLAGIWQVIPKDAQAGITLDANEAYEDLGKFAEVVTRLQREQAGLFQHILYLEQPLPRDLTHAPEAEPWIRKIGKLKPVIIDESDGALDAFRRAFAMGYAGTSHKNCKGFFKSLLNHALISQYRQAGHEAILSGEDLSNVPIVPLQQDFAALGVLGLTHCERNGHHYNYGLSMLTEQEKAGLARHHRDLYEQRGGEWFLNIRAGRVQCASLQVPGFGVQEEPDWASMMDMQKWVQLRHPA